MKGEDEMPYKIEDVVPEIIRLLESIGATNIKRIDDDIVGKHVRNRIVEAEVGDEEIAIISFPIVLRKQAKGKPIREQRYIDINSSAWGEIVAYWKYACIHQKKCFLIALRHIDNEIGEYIFSVEGDLSLLSGRSIYIHSNQLADMRNDLDINVYDVNEERACKLCIFKSDSLENYILNYENHISSSFLRETINTAIYDFIINDENTSIVERTTASEGKRIEYYTAKYERSKANRDKAVSLHGTKCFGCGFDFEKSYGKRGKGYIEIHHIKPLYELETEVTIDPKTDLVPVCSNCHRMIHRKKGDVLTMEDLKQLVKDNIEN